MPPAPASLPLPAKRPFSAPTAGKTAVLCLLALLVASTGDPAAGRQQPLRIDDALFWRMVTDFSEPDGYFHSDNLVSNELSIQRVVPELKQAAAAGAYLGVGPDQNFTYLIALEPQVAFIIDVRRQNALLHLLYKAIVEMAPNRAEFLSRLFSRRKPPNVERVESAAELVLAFAGQSPDPVLHERHAKEVLGRLMRKHRFPLSAEDQAALRRVYDAFFDSGPDISYTIRGMASWGDFPTYAELVQTTDESGQNHGYLASEAHYQTLRRLQERNLVVPIVGDFAGTKALRAVARFLGDRRVPVAAFYTSNVEFYLFRYGRWQAFAENLAQLPMTDRSYVIRTSFHQLDSYTYANGGLPRSLTLLEPLPELIDAFNGSRIRTYQDVLERSR